MKSADPVAQLLGGARTAGAASTPTWKGMAGRLSHELRTPDRRLVALFAREPEARLPEGSDARGATSRRAEEGLSRLNRILEAHEWRRRASSRASAAPSASATIWSAWCAGLASRAIRVPPYPPHRLRRRTARGKSLQVEGLARPGRAASRQSWWEKRGRDFLPAAPRPRARGAGRKAARGGGAERSEQGPPVCRRSSTRGFS